MQKSVTWVQMRSFVEANNLKITSFSEHLFEDVYRYELWVVFGGMELNMSIDTDTGNPDYTAYYTTFYPVGNNY